MTTLEKASGKLAKPDRGIENDAHAETVDFAEDDSDAVFVARPEHLGLRPPRMRSGGHYLGDTVAVALSRVPHALVMRTQNSEGAVMAGVFRVFDVAPDIGDDVIPLCPLYH